jgi:hypothetical protein
MTPTMNFRPPQQPGNPYRREDQIDMLKEPALGRREALHSAHLGQDTCISIETPVDGQDST